MRVLVAGEHGRRFAVGDLRAHLGLLEVSSCVAVSTSSVRVRFVDSCSFWPVELVGRVSGEPMHEVSMLFASRLRVEGASAWKVPSLSASR